MNTIKDSNEDFQVEKIFEIEFIDNSQLWVTINIVNKISRLDTLTISTLGTGWSRKIHHVIEQGSEQRILEGDEPNKYVLPFLDSFCNSESGKEIIKSYKELP